MTHSHDIAEGRANRPQGEGACPAADTSAGLKNNQDFSKARLSGGVVAGNAASEAHGAARNVKVRAPDSDALRRKLWRSHAVAFAKACEDLERESDINARLGIDAPPTVKPPPLPDELRGLRCGAKTRKGAPCKRGDLYASGRCGLHGGKSTGPATPAGRERAKANLALRWMARAP